MVLVQNINKLYEYCPTFFMMGLLTSDDDDNEAMI